MARKPLTVHRIVGTALAAATISTMLGGFVATGAAQAAAPVAAKCVPGSGNPLNPCP